MIATALSGLVPLRKTTAWGKYANITTIPRLYNLVTVDAIPYDTGGRNFVVADHVISGVVTVKIDGVKTTAYSLVHQPDTTGKTIAFIKLQNVIDLTKSTVTVTLKGMLHPVTGKLMTNPADIAWDLLQWTTGKTIDRSRFALFATACDAAGLEAGGAVKDGTQTMRALLDSIMDSCLSTWSGGMDGFGLVRGAVGDGFTTSVHPTQISAKTQLSDIATIVTVNYGYDWADSDYIGSVTYTAAEQVKQYGEIETTIEAPYCPTARQASRIAAYWCARLAIPQWSTVLTCDRSAAGVTLGGRISATHPQLPVAADEVVVTRREYSPANGELMLTVDLPSEPLPTVALTGSSGRLTLTSPVGVTVLYSANKAIVTITDDDGNPLAGAICTMDSGQTVTSDSSGIAVFTASTGKHTIEVRATGYDTFTMEVTV